MTGPQKAGALTSNASHPLDLASGEGGPSLKGQAFKFLWVWVWEGCFQPPRKQHPWNLELANLNCSSLGLLGFLGHVTYFCIVSISSFTKGE